MWKSKDSFIRFWGFSLLLTLTTLVIYYGIWFLVDGRDGFIEVFFVPNILFCFFFSVLTLGMNKFMMRLHRSHPFSLLRITLHALGVLLFNSCIVICVDVVCFSIWDELDDVIYWKDCYACSMIGSFLSLITFVSYYNKMLAEQYKANQSLELSMLKRQLSPHFMFNSLNTLMELIDENPEVARKFTLKLSNVYRYLLAHFNEDYITIGEAIRFTKDYCELLKIRYPDSFFIHFSDMQGNERDRIIPLSLQLLTENAIKHNLHTPKEPLTISYYRDRDYLVVRNNKYPVKSASGLSTGFGLAGLDKRYRLQCNRGIVVNRTEHDFEVKLPIIPAR